MSDNDAAEAPRRSPDIYTQIVQHGEMLDSEIQDLERMGVLLAEKSSTNTTLQQGRQQQSRGCRIPTSPPPQITGMINSNNDNNEFKSSIKAVDKSSSSTQGTSPSSTDEEHNNSSMTNVTDNNSTSFNGTLIDNATTKSSSSSKDVNEHSPIDHHQYKQIINNNNSSSSNIHKQLYTNLTNNLLNHHKSTQQSIQLSYMEQDHLFHDITTMTNRISYLQRQISAAREELIELGGDDMGEKLMRLSLVKEVDNICDSISDEDKNDVEEDEANNTFEVTCESFKPDEKTQSSRRRRGSLSTRRGSIQNSQTSGLSNVSLDDSQVSGASSIFRITFGGADGMPSRWRAREEEREKQEEEQAAAAAALLNGSNKTTSTSSANNERDGRNINTKEHQLDTLTQLVHDRESDITHLEKEMVLIDREKSSLENEVSVLKTNITKSQSTTQNEKQKLIGVLDVCLLDNARLGKELLETSVSLDERKMNVTLLGNELRTARKRFNDVHTKKEKERKEQRRKREQQQHQQQQQSQLVGNGKVSQFDYRSTSTNDGQSSSSPNNKVVRYEVPTNAMDAYQSPQDAIITDEQQQKQRKSGSLRSSRDPSLSSSGKSEGGGSRATVMSALTMDSSGLVDVLDGLGDLA